MEASNERLDFDVDTGLAINAWEATDVEAVDGQRGAFPVGVSIGAGPAVEGWLIFSCYICRIKILMR